LYQPGITTADYLLRQPTMRKIKIESLSQYYSNQGKPDSHSRSTEVYMVDIKESHLSSNDEAGMGMPLEHILEAEKLSQGWCGWGFYTHRVGAGTYPSVPVLLFENQEDAVFARLHWPASICLNRAEQ